MKKKHKKLGYMGIDQYGQHYDGLKHPRKDLLATLGRTHAEKMYVDTAKKEHKHIGYVIAGKWITVYDVYEWEGKA